MKNHHGESRLTSLSLSVKHPRQTLRSHVCNLLSSNCVSQLQAQINKKQENLR